MALKVYFTLSSRNSSKDSSDFTRLDLRKAGASLNAPSSNYRRAFTVLGSVTVKSYCFIFLGLLFVVVSQLQGNSTPKVSALVGNGFLVLKINLAKNP